MRRVDAIAMGLVCLFFIGMAGKFSWDLSHPEAWAGLHAGYDPHIYGPVCGLAALLYIGVAVRVFRDKQKIKQRKATLARLLAQAEELLRQKRWREAEPIVEECKHLSGYKE